MMNKQRKTSNLLNILDYNDSGSITTTGSITATSFTGSLFGTSSYTLNGVSASYAVSSSYTETASYAPAYLPLTGGTINGDIVLNGTASIAFLDVTYQSSSIIYSSGSNQFGDASDDVQTLMGTVIVTGSQQITGSLNVSQGVTGSFTGSFTGDGSQLTNLPISQLIREEFTWTSGSSQTFQLLSSASQVYSVEVQGQGALSSTQYNTTTSSIEILNQLEDNDYITVLYSSGPVASNPYYTQGQVDTLLSSKLDKDFSALPTASLPLSGSEELAIIQDGETKKVAASNVGFQFPTTSSIIYGVENSLARRIDTLLTDNYISATVVNSGTTLANIGSFFGGSFSQGTHTAYGSLLSTIPASKIVSATAVGSTAGYRQQVMRGIVNTLRSKVKTETYFSIANTIAPTSSRASIGYTTYASPPGNYNPSVTSILSFCNDDGEDYLKLCHRDTSGVVQSISLGTQFPARFSNQEHVYQCCFYLLGNHQGMATIRDLITGEYYESPVVEVYQINNNGFYFSVFMNNNITAEAVEPIFVGQVNKLIYGI